MLARALRASGCQRVCIVTDSVNQEVLEKCCQVPFFRFFFVVVVVAAEHGGEVQVLDPPVPLVTFPSPCDFDEVEGGTSYEKTTQSLVQELLQGDHTRCLYVSFFLSLSLFFFLDCRRRVLLLLLCAVICLSLLPLWQLHPSGSCGGLPSRLT